MPKKQPKEDFDIEDNWKKLREKVNKNLDESELEKNVEDSEEVNSENFLDFMTSSNVRPSEIEKTSPVLKKIENLPAQEIQNIDNFETQETPRNEIEKRTDDVYVPSKKRDEGVYQAQQQTIYEEPVPVDVRAFDERQRRLARQGFSSVLSRQRAMEEDIKRPEMADPQRSMSWSSMPTRKEDMYPEVFQQKEIDNKDYYQSVK